MITTHLASLRSFSPSIRGQKTDLPLPCMFLVWVLWEHTWGSCMHIYKRTKNCTPWKQKRWILKTKNDAEWNMQVLKEMEIFQYLSQSERNWGCQSSFLCQFYYVCWVEVFQSLETKNPPTKWSLSSVTPWEVSWWQAQLGNQEVTAWITWSLLMYLFFLCSPTCHGGKIICMIDYN